MKISKSAIFLFELMAVILIFTAAAAICTDIFARAFQVSDDSRNLTKATILTETAAEEFKSHPTIGSTSPYYYDENWKYTERDDAVFVMDRNVEYGKNIVSCNLVMSKIEGVGKVTTITQIKAAVFVQDVTEPVVDTIEHGVLSR